MPAGQKSDKGQAQSPLFSLQYFTVEGFKDLADGADMVWGHGYRHLG
jgi:hypothetical protein